MTRPGIARDTLVPVVLVGGRSTRFGRDKLKAELSPGGPWLVDRAIEALRAVFGPRVLGVGDCDPEVAARVDRHLPDTWPGTGPAGGLLAALQATGADVFLLAGDLPGIDAAAVETIVASAEAHPEADAVLACTNIAGSSVLEPCIGVYRQSVAATLLHRLGLGRRSLHDLVPEAALVRVGIGAHSARNANTIGDLA